MSGLALDSAGLAAHQLREPALGSRRGIPVHQVLAAGAVEHRNRLSVGLLGLLAAGGGADLLDGRAELAPLGPIVLTGRFGLPHALLG